MENDGAAPNPTPPSPPIPDPDPRPSPPPQSPFPTGWFVILAVLFAPAIVNLLLGSRLFPSRQDDRVILAIGVACVGAPLAGVFAGLRIGGHLSRRPGTQVVAKILCAIACVAMSFVAAFGGCVVGVLSRLDQ